MKKACNDDRLTGSSLLDGLRRFSEYDEHVRKSFDHNFLDRIRDLMPKVDFIAIESGLETFEQFGDAVVALLHCFGGLIGALTCQWTNFNPQRW